MKHAILITAYKDFEALEELIDKFDNSFNIYIHIDKKSKISDIAVANLLKKEQVKYLDQTYRVNWGGVNHLKSYLLLSRKALEKSENAYFHLITGEDYPLKGIKYFNEFLLEHSSDKYSYLDYFKLPSAEWRQGGLQRLEYYNFFDVFNAKSALGSLCIRILQKIQRVLKLKRPLDFSDQLYGGSTYWTLSREALQFVIDFTHQNPAFLKRFNFTFCAEEIYFQTVLLNSVFATRIRNDNLRFVDWESGKGGYPAYLDETDYEALIRSNKLFGRKIKSAYLKELLNLNNEKS